MVGGPGAYKAASVFRGYVKKRMKKAHLHISHNCANERIIHDM
jgi:hypothetical protein